MGEMQIPTQGLTQEVDNILMVNTGRRTVERLRKFTEQLETDPELARRILNQTPFEQAVLQARNS